MKKLRVALVCMLSLACTSETDNPESSTFGPPVISVSSGFVLGPQLKLPTAESFTGRMNLSQLIPLFNETDCDALNGEWNGTKSRCTLTEDVSGRLTLGPGIDLNCDGHAILGDGGDIGVVAADECRVSNCLIRALDPEEPLGVGLFIDGVSGFTCEHCDIGQADFSIFSNNGSGNTISHSQLNAPVLDIESSDNDYIHVSWTAFSLADHPSFPFHLVMGNPNRVGIFDSFFPIGEAEWGVVAIDPTQFRVTDNTFEGGFGGVILDGVGGSVLVSGNRFTNLELPLQNAVDGDGFLFLDNHFEGTGGPQIGTFPGQTSSGHFYLFNTFMNGMDTDNDFRDMGAVFDGLEGLVFGFNTVLGAVGSGLHIEDAPVHVLFNTLRNNGGPGIELNVEDFFGEVWLNDIRDNAVPQVFLNDPAQYAAQNGDLFLGNYYGQEGFIPGVSSNGTDACPLRHPVPQDVGPTLLHDLRPFEGDPFPDMFERVHSTWRLDDPTDEDWWTPAIIPVIVSDYWYAPNGPGSNDICPIGDP